MKLDRQAPIPLYYQLKNVIKTMVMEELSAGDPIPSERELSERYQISRMTARQAVNALVEEGFLYREHGKGTFVAKTKIDKGVTTPITSFSEDVLSRGMKPGSIVLNFEVIRAPNDVQMILGGETVYKIRRIRLADSIPLAVETTFLLKDSFVGLEEYDLGTDSLYRIIQHDYGVRFSRLRQSVFIHSVKPDEARWLNLAVGTSVLYATRTLFDVTGQPVEYTQAIYHPDRYRFSMDIKL